MVEYFNEWVIKDMEKHGQKDKIFNSIIKN